MNKHEIEKSLKRYLKKKMTYSFSLLIAFLITGGLVNAADLNQAEILSRLKAERERLEQKLSENEKKLTELEKKNLKLLKEADFYVKPEKGSVFSMPYWSKRVKSIDKEWKGSVRKATAYDSMRDEFNGLERTGESGSLAEASTYSANSNNKSSGWLNMNTNFGNNMNTYDVEAKLFILPVVKPPVVNIPTAPVVSFTAPVAPTELNIEAPSIIDVKVGTISVAAPSVTIPTISTPVAITAPTIADVRVNEPSVNIAIGAINVAAPGGLTIPPLQAPTVSINPNVVTPPAIVPPNPQISAPVAPAAPNFTSYVAPGGSWLNASGEGGKDYSWNNTNGYRSGIVGYNTFNPGILAAYSLALAGKNDAAQTAANLTDGKVIRQTNINLPVFGSMDLVGGTVYAYRDGNGAKTGYQGVSSPTKVLEYTPQYYSGTNGGAYIEIFGSQRRPGHNPGPIVDKEITQKNRWIMHNHRDGTIIDGVTFKIGGPNGGGGESGVVLVRNDSVMTIKNSTINLLGLTTIADDVLHWGPHYQTSLSFEGNVNIKILADENTLYSNVPYSDQGIWSRVDQNAKFINWGRPHRDDGTGKKGVFGKTNLGIDTKVNTIFYIRANGSYRWNGYNGNLEELSDKTKQPYSHVANPGALMVYTPLMGRVRYENKDSSGNKGNFYFNGSGNVGTWVNKYTPDRTKYAYAPATGPGAGTWSADEAPIIDLGVVHMNGDGNVGIYLAQNNSRPDFNGIYQGRLPIDFKIGENLYVDASTGAPQASQSAAGNSKGDASKSSGNVALYVSSGQRKELTVANGYFPATTNLIFHDLNSYAGSGGMASGTQVGYPDLNTPAHAIKNLVITDYNVTFGKYSKDNIAVVARNGSVVELNPGQATITDGQNASTPDNDRADGTIIGFAEGVWFNPRPSKTRNSDNTAITSQDMVNNLGVTTDGTPGQKYVPQYGSSVIIHKPMELGSKNAVAVFAKDGAKIETKGIKIYGGSSTAAFALSTVKWNTKAHETDASKGGGTAAPSVMTIAGDVVLTNGDKNKGVVAVNNGGDGASISVNGNLTVKGLGAYAKGANTSVTINGSGSNLTSGADGSLIALDGGKLSFGGGTITHAVDNSLPFYSANGSRLNFTGTTTVNISKGIAFYGASSDFTAASGFASLYNGMGKVTVNLTDNGVNLGVFKDIDAIWDGTSNYLNHTTNGLKNIPKVAGIVDGGYWYKSSLEGGKLTVKTDVNRDKISSGTTVGDGFNDIVMERKQVILEDGKSITSAQGKGLYMASNKVATTNAASGYTIKDGSVKIEDGTNSTVATFVNFGHITTEANGTIEVNKGVAAYGVNGSKIVNKGTLKVDGSDATNQGVAIMALTKNTTATPDTYGIFAGKAAAGSKWIEIENKGTIDITGTDAIAIYAKNNHTNVAARALSTIYNKAKIELGDNSKAIVVQTVNGVTEGGTITLEDSGTNQDIKLGKNSIGVYAEYSDIKLNTNYGIALKEGGVAIQAKGVGKVDSAGKNLNVEYKGTASGSAMALGFTGTASTDTFTNNINLKLTNTAGAKTLVGAYAEGKGTLTNNGDITAEYDGTYGILSKGVDVVNSGAIKVGLASSTNSDAVGVYIEDAALTTDGDKIKIQGHGSTTKTPIGIYAEAKSTLATNKTIEVKAGANALKVEGKKGIGIYLKDGSSGNNKLILTNKSNIELTKSDTVANDRRIGISLKNVKNSGNETSGKITVNKNNIGIYNDNSELTHSGILEVKHSETGTENIGAHNTGANFKFKVVKSGANAGLVDVEGHASTIGISAITSGAERGEIAFDNAEVKVNATDMSTGKIPLGVYAKGNNILVSSTGTTEFTVSPNAVGIYLNGDSSSKIQGPYKYKLSSKNTQDRLGIGAYLTGGSYATTTATDKVKVESTATATNANGPIRPIGLFYGANSTKNEANLEILSSSKEAIGMYGNNLSTFENTGKVEVGAKGIGAYFAGTSVTNKGIFAVTADDAYGLYLKGGNSTTEAAMTASGKNSVATILTGNAKLENKSGNTITSSGDGSIGVYAEKGAEFKNSGNLNATMDGKSIGAFAVEAKLINAATINSKHIALYAKKSSTVENKGTINIDSGKGIIATDKSTVNLLTSGTITSTKDAATAVIADDKSIVNLNGTNISLTGKNSIGIQIDKNTNAVLTSGNMTVGEKGLGLYTKDSKVDLKAYTGTFTLGNQGIGIYSKNSTVNGGTLKVAYNHSTTDLGVGIFYDGGTVSNNTKVEHTGKNLVNILSNGSTITNTANQNVQAGSIGIYGKGGTINNSATLTLVGDKSVGVYLDNGATLTNIGTINGNAASTYKVGVYAKSGTINGNTNYNFAIDNGVAMYLDSNAVNNFTGTLNMSGNSVSGKRAIGIYFAPSTTPKNINTNINLSGKDSIGMFLSNVGTNGSTVNYGGTLNITGNSNQTNYGIGALVQDKSTFTLTSTGKVKIAGENNLGFYVEEGGTLKVSGGTVENTKEGIFAYLKNGQLSFTAGTTPNINYLNVFVSGNKGSIQNATAITVGTRGLQADSGAKILNDTKGEIKGNVEGAKALVGTNAGTIIENKGSIKLNGDKSVALYTSDNAVGTSTGSVEVGKNSVAYYVKDNGLLNVSGTTKAKEGSSIFFIDKGRVNYTGADIVLSNKTTALTLAGNSPTTVANFNNKTITVGEQGTGIYITKDGELNTPNTVQNLAKINVKKSANGIYLNNDKNFASNIAIDLVEQEAIGILSTKDGNVTYNGNINSTSEKVKAIVHTSATATKGDTRNTGIIKVIGNSSIGMYAKNGAVLENINQIEIGKGTSSATAVGLYGENQTAVKNSGTIKMLESAIGIYGKNTTITNSGIIQNSGKNNNGIYGVESDVINTGNISLGDSSNGIYASSTATKTITNSGNVSVGSKNSSAIFGSGKVGINNTAGNIQIGSESVAFATIAGDINVGASTKISSGESSTYIYTEKGNAVNNANFSLSNYSIGMYTKEGTIKNYGNVIVGKSLVGNGNNKVSVGMATEKGTIENFGNISVPDKNGVGMVANKGGVAINKAGANINVSGELAYGMQATKGSTLINEGTVSVSGKDSRGIAATDNSKIVNTGTGVVNVSGQKAQGIYVDFGSKVKNDGTININSSTGIGVLAGSGGIVDNSSTGTININVAGGKAKVEEGASQLQAGAITIKGPKAYIGNVEIQNSGTINVNAPLDFNEIKLGSTQGHIGTINAKSFESGKFIVLPNSVLGSNKDMYTIQYLGGIQNVPNNGSITAISYSASFVADIQKDATSHNLARVVLVRVPYTKMTEGTKAAEFGKGLDELYKGLSNKGPQSPEQKIFDGLRMIPNKDQLGATFDRELRGNVYANVQRRMLDINETFTTSYENLKNSSLYARNRFKTGAIVTSGESRDKNAGVEDYKTKTTGFIVMKEKDYKTYGRNTDVSLAFTETRFNFDLGSKEKVHSLQLGVGFENFIGENNWKYSTRGEFTVNRHHMKRKIHLSNGTFENKGRYWSSVLEWKNKLRYEMVSTSGTVKAGLFGTFNMGYGKFRNIKENGDGVELDIKSENMYMIRPGVGGDLSYNYYTRGGKISLVGTATAEYEMGRVYDGVNQARIKNSSAGYYDLEEAKKVKDIYKVGAQLQYETNAGHKIGVGVTREEGSVKSTKYGVNAVYKF